MHEHSTGTIRTVDRLLNQLLDLEPAAREQQLSDIRAQDATLAQELERLLGFCLEESMELAPGGALEGSLARECLLGLGEVAELSPGTRIGPYRIEGLIGKGGMSEVYRAARNFEGFSQPVALKLVRSDRVDAALRERLLSEQRTLVRLDHPNIARFLDAGIAPDGNAYLTMELVEGALILEHANAARVDVRTLVRWMIDLCDALEHAHAQLVVHCDIKPSNVLIDRRGQLRLLDFGIAHILGDINEDQPDSRIKLFTPDCAAPEQITGKPVATATDIFQVGALLYRLIVGKPWLCESGAAIITKFDAIVHEYPVAPSRRLLDERDDPAVRASAEARGAGSVQALSRQVRGSLDAIVLKCLAKSSGERYASVEQLRSDLRAWLQHRPVSAVPANSWTRTRLWLRRNRKVVGVAAAGLACLAVVSSVSIIRINAEREAKAREQDSALAVEHFLAKVFLQASPFLSEGEGQSDVLQTLSSVGDSLLASEEDLGSRTKIRLITVLGRLELDRGRPDLAEARVRKALEFAEDTGVGESDVAFELRRLLGEILSRQDRIGEAIAVLESASAQTGALALNSVRRAQFETMIGDLHRREGRLSEAEHYFEPALTVLLEDTFTLDSEYLNALLRSVLYIDQSGKGMQRLEPVVRRLESVDGARESPILKAQRLMLLSYVELLVGRPGSAGPHAQEAATIYASVLGEDHAQTIKARTNACAMFRDDGALDLAQRQCMSALDSLQRQGRAFSDDATVLRLNLAGIGFSSGDFVAAQEFLTVVSSTLDAESAPFQHAFSSVLQGRVHYRRGQPRAALEYYRRAADIQRKNFPDHTELAAHIGIHMASTLISIGRLEEARSVLASTEPMAMPPGLLRDRLHAERLIIQGELAAMSGKNQSAKEAIEQGLEAYNALSPLSPNERVWSLLDAGEVLRRIGEDAAARDLFLKALDLGLSEEQTPGLWAWAVLRLEQMAGPQLDADRRSVAERIRREQLGPEAFHPVRLP